MSSENPSMSDNETVEVMRQAALEILEQGEILLKTISADAFRTRVPEVFNATIGGHYRHCLEHFEAVFAEPAGIIDYDARKRDAALESDRLLALKRTRGLRRALAAFRDEAWWGRLTGVRCQLCHGRNGSPVVPTTMAREMMYAVMHAIHHFAMIAVMSRSLDFSLPEGFGVAPATLRHRHSGSPRSGE